MAVEWKIVNLERTLPDGIVTTAHWTASEVDGEYTGSTYGSVGITLNEENEIIPFDDLTEEEVVAWVQETLGEEQVEAIEASIAAQIELAKAPTSASGTPW
jgi:hypothetical protein